LKPKGILFISDSGHRKPLDPSIPHLTKPVHMDVLLNVLAGLLVEKSAGA
jgi:hypothetical protein